MDSKLRRAIGQMNLEAEFLDFDAPVRTVQEAAKAVGVTVGEMTKNLLLIDDRGNLIVVVLSGSDRLDVEKVAALLGRRVRMAKPSEVSTLIGFEAGAVPIVGVEAMLILDINVVQKNYVYGSGGTSRSLVRIPTRILLETLKPKVGVIAVNRPA